MKYLKQFLIILAVCCVGELLRYFLPLPIPASVYGLVIMLILLITKIIRLEQVKDAANFLIEIMPILFIPAIVGLITAWDRLQQMLLPTCIIVVVSFLSVMCATGKVTDYLIDRKENKNDE